MKFLKIVFATAVLLAVPVSSLAQPAPQPPAQTAPVPAAPAPPIATHAPQTQITTTAPVSSDTTISVGTWAGQVLTWIAAAFAVPIGSLLSMWLYRLMQLVGIQATDMMRAQLQAIIVNGLNSAAAKSAERLEGTGRVEIKSVIVADAVKYAQAHGAETMKALGLDPQSGAAVEAIKARIETAIINPTTPTSELIAPTPEVIPVPPAPVRRS